MIKSLKNIALVFLTLLAIIIFFGIYFDLSREELEKKYAKGASDFLNLSDGTRIHYRDEGVSNLPVIVFLHGMNGSLFNFERLVPFLKDDFRLISLDFPGFGLTGPIPSNDYSRNSFIETINQLTDHLDVSNFSLAGNSMGGGIAWRYALRYPEKVESLILLSSSGVFSKEYRDDYQIETKDSPWVWSLMKSKAVNYLLTYYTPKFFATQGLRASVFNQDIATQELAYQFHELTLLNGSRKAILSMFSKRSRDYDSVDILRYIKAPVLVIHGKEDNIIPFESSSVFVQNIKDVEFKIYNNVGHLPMYEVPLKVSDDIKEFLSKKL